MFGLHSLPPHLKLWSPAALIATWFHSGLIKPASGTWGSLAALAFGISTAYYFGLEGPCQMTFQTVRKRSKPESCIA